MGRTWEAVCALHEALAVGPQDPVATDLLARALEENASAEGWGGGGSQGGSQGNDRGGGGGLGAGSGIGNSFVDEVEDEADELVRRKKDEISRRRGVGRRGGRRQMQAEGAGEGVGSRASTVGVGGEDGTMVMSDEE